MEAFDMSLVNWSRAQFALTAMYHWIFVPLTLGLSFIIAFMHTRYYKTGSEKWKNTTKFWMKLFGINFAIGVATGIILEFEFGTNWSNYSWFVGDIFGAPLAIEGIMAFFLESTFIAVMFFGWNRVSKKFHMLSSWFVAIGANLSALWILVANAWMQNPVGMKFNPDTARNEMENFAEVLFSPTAINKFLHTISNGYVVASLFVIGISAWYILKGRHLEFAKRSILVASVFGLLSSIFVVITGDSSAHNVAQIQPMKFAAMEGIYEGSEGVGLTTIGMVTPGKRYDNNKNDFVFALKVPKMLSYLANRNSNSFVPGINDLIDGNKDHNIIPISERMENGKLAINAFKEYNNSEDAEIKEGALKTLEENYQHFGYGYLPDKKSAIPNVPITFYSFHIMVSLGFFFIVLFGAFLIFSAKQKIESRKKWLKLAVWSIPLGFLASELGWVVAEVGRQPWTIQDILPTMVSTSHLSTSSVQVTFWAFVALFTVLLIAEIKIMLYQIKSGPKNMEE
jgi:cytochrome d ubiquinol oxidase subunit I